MYPFYSWSLSPGLSIMISNHAPYTYQLESVNSYPSITINAHLDQVVCKVVDLKEVHSRLC